MRLYGHRGAADPSAPENTLASVDRALAGGADGVEVDVRLTADGVLVCHHDAHLGRTTGDDRQLSSLSYGQLGALRVAGHRLPRLADVLELVGERGRLVVEVKTAPGIAVATVEELRRHRLHDVVVSSFDRPRLGVVRDAGLRSALLSRPGVPVGVAVRRALEDRHVEAHVHVRSLLFELPLIGAARARGLGVVAWTADREQDLQRLAAAGADAAICDDPLRARRLLAARLPA